MSNVLCVVVVDASAINPLSISPNCALLSLSQCLYLRTYRSREFGFRKWSCNSCKHVAVCLLKERKSCESKTLRLIHFFPPFLFFSPPLRVVESVLILNRLDIKAKACGKCVNLQMLVTTTLWQIGNVYGNDNSFMNTYANKTNDIIQ